jgi:maltose alpha-D-glucosyltransferase/alpha-amylase
VDSSPDAPTVESQQNDANSLLNRVRRLIQLRKAEPALAANAEFIPVAVGENTYPFVFIRAACEQILLAVFNPAERTETAEFKLNITAKRFKRLAGDPIKISCAKPNYIIDEPGVSYAIKIGISQTPEQ